MSKFGKALRRVTDLHDSYPHTCCALCKQLKHHARLLADYKGEKRFKKR